MSWLNQKSSWMIPKNKDFPDLFKMILKQLYEVKDFSHFKLWMDCAAEIKTWTPWPLVFSLSSPLYLVISHS